MLLNENSGGHQSCYNSTSGDYASLTWQSFQYLDNGDIYVGLGPSSGTTHQHLKFKNILKTVNDNDSEDSQ